MVDRGRLRVRVWERGAGITLACAPAPAPRWWGARLRGDVDEQVVVALPGGELEVTWPGAPLTDGAPTVRPGRSSCGARRCASSRGPSALTPCRLALAFEDLDRRSRDGSDRATGAAGAVESIVVERRYRSRTGWAGGDGRGRRRERRHGPPWRSRPGQRNHAHRCRCRAGRAGGGRP